MSQDLSLEQVQQNVREETDIEVLRESLLQANALIKLMDDSYQPLVEELDVLEEENEQLSLDAAAIFDDAERYALLKFILPAVLEIAATAGARSDEAPAIFGSLDPIRLDASLDTMIGLGQLDLLREAFEREAAEAAEGSRLD